jgi:hypothetical protein
VNPSLLQCNADVPYTRGAKTRSHTCCLAPASTHPAPRVWNMSGKDRYPVHGHGSSVSLLLLLSVLLSLLRSVLLLLSPFSSAASPRTRGYHVVGSSRSTRPDVTSSTKSQTWEREAAHSSGVHTFGTTAYPSSKSASRIGPGSKKGRSESSSSPSFSPSFSPCLQLLLHSV